MFNRLKNWLGRTRLFRALGTAGTVPADPGEPVFMARLCEEIAEAEGIDQPWKWPGVSSGITLGCGFDLGYTTVKDFRAAWGRHLGAEAMRRLETVIGITGERAQSKARLFPDITVTRSQALEVLSRTTAPLWRKWARGIWPEMERKLSPAGQVALILCVGNRGTSLAGARREEMRNIATLLKMDLPPDVLKRRIAAELRGMKRLWPGVRGLQYRREREARLCEGGFD